MPVAGSGLRERRVSESDDDLGLPPPFQVLTNALVSDRARRCEDYLLPRDADEEGDQAKKIQSLSHLALQYSQLLFKTRKSNVLIPAAPDADS
jgi:hypothetical protein